MTKNPDRPRFASTSLKNGSTMFLKFALVSSSFNSKSCASAALSRACSTVRNKRRTLILSNADANDSAVLSPNRSVPTPGFVIMNLYVVGIIDLFDL